MQNRLRPWWLVVLLSGCVQLPSRDDVVLDTPSTWDATTAASTELWPDTTWWQGFGSAELNTLVSAAQAGNPDLAASAARVLQAEAQARIAGAPLWPAVDGSVGVSEGGVINRSGSSVGSFSAAVGASYELDFWGGNRAGLLAAEAALRSSRYDRETVALTLTTGVAGTYLQVLTLRERLTYARESLAIAERVLGIAEARVRAGAATRLDVAQQRGVVAALRSAIPPVEQQEREARAALALLLGQLSQGFTVAAENLNEVTVPAVTPGLPSELLMRRPDVRRAEAQLSAADANVAAARAALFPSVRLTASAGAQSGSFSALFENNPAYSIGASLARPIFDAGRLSGQVDAADASREALIHGYRSAVLASFADVDTALSSTAAVEQQQAQQTIQLEQARIAFEVAEARYRAGAVDLLTVLDAQRTLYSAQDQNVQLKLSRLQAAITLYRALGGGWTDAE